MFEAELDKFYSYLNLQKRFSPHTVNSYRTDLSQFFSFLSQESPVSRLDEISHHDVRAFMAGLIDSGLSATSVNRKISALRSFFKYLQKNQVISASPMQKVMSPKKPKKLPVFVDEKQMKTLFSYFEFKPGFEGKRDRLLMDILYQTGIRRAELINMKEADVDILNSQLKVLGKRNKERIIPFHTKLGRNLDEYMRVKQQQGLNSPYLLVTMKNEPLSAFKAGAIVKKILEAITTGKKKSPHVLRHTFATHLLNSGADINAVKELLGHSSLAATQVYTHNTIEKLKHTYKQAHPRSGQ